MRNRLLVVVLVLSGAAWFVHSPTWVRPAALAVFAVAAAALLWGRSGGARRPSSPSTADEPAARPEAAAEVPDSSKPESSKDVWDALDRGEDPTAR
jgi:uncharacterized membrane protein (TIGR02234 family)